TSQSRDGSGGRDLPDRTVREVRYIDVPLPVRCNAVRIIESCPAPDPVCIARSVHVASNRCDHAVTCDFSDRLVGRIGYKYVALAVHGNAPRLIKARSNPNVVCVTTIGIAIASTVLAQPSQGGHHA